ncbi:GNAT family N-acetyltransferase [Kibdelosporangium philippinense]|uniref:GNAT family N-acetyltransferase n=1 Tax=Kibdelosporangium philippinense TaxID=211113 RepID=A0ABS8ZE72_9PSEU|nr:GNAT family N-acetyltransferase [Kibdelosporangium philippinense]MCE7005837.1 GNAT family N-acetyltransferase [Kibdelosporangium philippinense]
MRKIVVRGDGFALAELAKGDQEYLAEHGDRAFDVDRDGRAMPYEAPVHRLAITDETGTELLGRVMWHPVIYGPSYGCVAWNFGRELLPRVRGKGIGTAVLKALVRYLFDTTDVDRIEGSTDVTNVRAQKSLEKAGFTREGVLRGAQLRGGKRRDMISYSLLRTDK